MLLARGGPGLRVDSQKARRMLTDAAATGLTFSFLRALSLSLSLYLSIYLCVCVCVSVCVRECAKNLSCSGDPDACFALGELLEVDSNGDFVCLRSPSSTRSLIHTYTHTHTLIYGLGVSKEIHEVVYSRRWSRSRQSPKKTRFYLARLCGKFRSICDLTQTHLHPCLFSYLVFFVYRMVGGGGG